MTTTALVTGIGRINGIGYHIARGLLTRGLKVSISVRKKAACAAALEALGSACQVYEVELSDTSSIRHFGEKFRAENETLDVLVNNAGTLIDGATALAELSASKMLDTYKVNTVAPVLIFQEVLPLLTKSKSPRVINVSSSAGQLGDGTLQAWAPAYSASKAALNAITQQMAAAYPTMAVNSVCPGWCSTDMGGAQAPLTAEQGADTPIWLATEAPSDLTATFWKSRMEIPW